MKLTLVLLLLSTALCVNAQVFDLELKRCFSKAKRYYRLNGQDSDRPLTLNAKEYLSSGVALKDLQGKYLAIFNEDKLIYTGTGSYYSGYFIDYIVVDPKKCEGEIIYNIYSE